MIALKASMVALIAGMLLAGTSTIDSVHAQKAKKQSGGYAACKAKLSQVPPCSNYWTRNCAAQCGSKF